MRRVIVHYRPLILALHGSVWHTLPLTTIPTITLVALPMQYAKLLFFFLPTVYFIHFICGWAVSVESQYLLPCFNLPNVMSQAVTDIWAIFTSESAHSHSAGHIGDLEGAGASGIRATGARLGWAAEPKHTTLSWNEHSKHNNAQEKITSLQALCLQLI